MSGYGPPSLVNVRIARMSNRERHTRCSMASGSHSCRQVSRSMPSVRDPPAQTIAAPQLQLRSALAGPIVSCNAEPAQFGLPRLSPSRSPLCAHHDAPSTAGARLVVALVGTWSGQRQSALASRSSHRTTSVARVRGSVTWLAANWIRFDSFWGTSRSRRRNATLEANSDCEARSTMVSESSRTALELRVGGRPPNVRSSRPGRTYAIRSSASYANAGRGMLRRPLHTSNEARRVYP
jgi:hypothetical protein